MQFKLIQKAQNGVKTIFHVLNESGDVCGSINVKTGREVDDLLACWNGGKDVSSVKQSPANALAAAFMKHRKPFRQEAILRGC
jgi:hypothetical protein